MRFIILTTFPSMYESFLSSSIIARAIEKKLIEVNIVNIRDYTLDKNHRTDTPPIGGGAGLIMKCQPIVDALKASSSPNSKKIIMSPRGKVFNQKIALSLSKEEEIVILCGHYEGIDERVYSYFDEEISIGDYILTGGETASFVIIDAISRLVNGVINNDSIKEETFNNDLIEYPQYTEPYEFDNKCVPDILYSGNHRVIEKYRHKMSLGYTKKYRPDLFNKLKLSKTDLKLIEQFENNKLSDEELKAIEKGKKFTKNH